MEQSNNLLDPKLGPLPKSDAIDTMNKILLVNDQENWRRRQKELEEAELSLYKSNQVKP